MLILIFFGLTGLTMERAFYKSHIAAESGRLFQYIFGLISIAEMDGTFLVLPTQLKEKQFNSPESGLVGIVLNEERQIIWESLSSEWFAEGEWVKSNENLVDNESEFGTYNDWIFQRNRIVWPDSNDVDRYFEIWVFENAEPFNAAVQTFRSQLWIGLLVATVVLLVLLSLVTAWGLRPLRLIATDLNRIRSGESEALAGSYPKELTPLTQSLNQLLHSEQGQRERYRKAMADLAHSLKTPLAVMRAVANPNQVEIREQVDRMDQIVRYQLQRAVTDARKGPVLGQRCDVNGAVKRLGKALEKAFANDDKVLDLPDTDGEIYVAMDSNDVLEVLGNLIENAFKYGRSVIMVSFEVNEKTVLVNVDDDGPGLSEQESQQVLTRGKRLDSLQPGQGIGLAMVNDILSSYRLDMSISKSPLGGARFSLALPAVH
ncbi:ATP-binding protein [Reinekea sp. G2M2-21]|uniref:ATP-binding protein n=1 Tax=Reinekea sp. G2M2-21 TaxID=2788942 RepID=UPI0018AA9CE3